jgi:hypothetical protein
MTLGFDSACAGTRYANPFGSAFRNVALWSAANECFNRVSRIVFLLRFRYASFYFPCFSGGDPMRRRSDMSSSSSGTKKVCSFPVTFSAQKYLFVHKARKWNEERERDHTPFPLDSQIWKKKWEIHFAMQQDKTYKQGHDITNSRAPQATKKQRKTPDPLTRSCNRNSWEIWVVVSKHHPNLSSMGRTDQWADRSKQVLMQKMTWRRIAVETHPPFDDTIVCTTAMCSRVDLTLPPTMGWLLMREGKFATDPHASIHARP